MADFRKRLEHRLKRLQGIVSKLAEKYSGKEIKLTYHAGYDFGYLKGQVSILEDMVDNLTTQPPSDHVREALKILENLKVRFLSGRVESDLEIEDSINEALTALAPADKGGV